MNCAEAQKSRQFVKAKLVGHKLGSKKVVKRNHWGWEKLKYQVVKESKDIHMSEWLLEHVGSDSMLVQLWK